jgi:hypothetical protein
VTADTLTKDETIRLQAEEIERLRLMLGSLLAVTAGRMADVEIKNAYGMLGWDVMRRAREVLAE